MKPFLRRLTSLIAAGVFLGQTAGQAQALDQIGLTILRALTTNLNGSGIRVAQVEAGYGTTTNWQVNPSVVAHPLGFLTYLSSSGSTTNFPNALGGESAHANDVGNAFYGLPLGVATNVSRVDNFDANTFVQGAIIGGNYIITLPATNINDPVVNQSFTFGNVPTNEQTAADKSYDNYAAQYRTLFVSAVDNGGNVHAPGTSYNGIGVGAYGVNAASSIGPTIDNGRCKPDLIAPSSATSYATPYVSGAAAVLLQAARRGDGGSDTNSAGDIRTLKALLLNGAVKPTGWTNGNSSPLDARYGAGLVNLFNAYEQLAGGKHSYIVSTTVTSGGVHPPTGASGTMAVLNGWDFNTNTSSATQDAINHYYFNLTNSPANFIGVVTLVWNRQQNQTGINNLDLYLYNCANSNLVACSTSLVDNVEHIYATNLPPGRYDLQVWKAAGLNVSFSETYALAFAFNSPVLNQARTGTNVIFSWPAYPAGYWLEGSTDLIGGSWNTNNLTPTLTGSTNTVPTLMTNALQFFRLRSPNF
jgi:Subtilase family